MDVHPRQRCLSQGAWRACRGGASAAVHAPGHGQRCPRRPAAEEALWLAEKLVCHDCTHEPAHKTLFRAPPGKGLPIGNLNSQFFANVYVWDSGRGSRPRHPALCRCGRLTAPLSRGLTGNGVSRPG
jgi:hypothetical protein